MWCYYVNRLFVSVYEALYIYIYNCGSFAKSVLSNTTKVYYRASYLTGTDNRLGSKRNHRLCSLDRDSPGELGTTPVLSRLARRGLVETNE